MDPFTAGFLSGLATNLTTEAIKFIAPSIQNIFKRPAKKKALENCFHAGIVLLVASAQTKDKEKLYLLEDIFKNFFQNVDVCFHIAGLLRGEPLNQNELLNHFRKEGYVSETLPGINPRKAFTIFENAFIQAAIDEPELQGIIQTGALLKQVRQNRELIDTIKDFIQFWNERNKTSFYIENGIIISEEVITGDRVPFEISFVDPIETDWEHHYLKTLIKYCDPLDLTPIDATRTQIGHSDENEQIRITDVFTSLFLKDITRDTMRNKLIVKLTRKKSYRNELERKEQESIPAIEAIAMSSRLVILGQPGSGKSTLVNHLATQLARVRLGFTVPKEKLKGWTIKEKPIPVRIILRRFAAWLPTPAPANKSGLVWQYLENQCEQMGCKESFNRLKHKIVTEGGIIFFDGLDEVSESDEFSKRTLIRQAIEQFSAPLENCRIVVTCREYAYRNNDAWHLPTSDFPVVELALFNLDQINSFVHTWYQIIGPQKAWNHQKCQKEAENLYLAIKDWAYLRELAQSPLLLTLMSQVHGKDGYLPKDRADLYERAVLLLLAHWENRIKRDELGSERKVAPDLVLSLNLQTGILLQALEKTAFLAHERQEKEGSRGERAADIQKMELLDCLGTELGSLDEAEQVIKYIQQRAGLLQARSNFNYAFPHRTFQEYLAAAYLLRQAEFDSLLVKRVKRDITWWREVFLLAAGASRKTPRMISNLIDALLYCEPDETNLIPENMELALLAGQALYETAFHKNVQAETEPGRYSFMYNRIISWLLKGITADQSLTPPYRNRAGDTLAQLGDSRPEVLTIEAMQFCLVPSGKFWLGSPDSDKMASKWEKPCHQLDIPYDFWMSRYPVTNAQFQQFVDDENGYCASDWWTKDGLSWRGDRKGPNKYGGVFDLPNHPVVMVCWYEALAFTRWLTARSREKGLLSGKWEFGLPSEAEWEKAARGGLQVPAVPIISSLPEIKTNLKPEMRTNSNAKQRYPWGTEAEPNLANYDATGINATSTVGCFPKGYSVYGCEEISGNVWEFTRSLWGKDYNMDFKYRYNPSDGRENLGAPENVARIFRGGAFYNSGRDVRCAGRLRHDPDYRNDVLGFRVVLSLFTSER